VSGFLIYFFLDYSEKKMRKSNDHSLSITTDKAHYEGDFWFNALSALGMALVWFTKLEWIDSICAMVACAFIVKATYPIFRRSIKDILNHEVSPELQEKIVKITIDTDDRVKGIHRLRSRLLGHMLIIDFHLSFPADISLVEAHAIADQVTENLNLAFPNIDVIIHLEPDNLTEGDESNCRF
jgi:cation diffusion facilitator family transporter